MRRDDVASHPDDDGGRADELQRSMATAAVLVDAVRRRIFQAVRRARRPLTREEAAATARVSRKLAAFHLDKLVEAGLLRTGSQSAAGVRRAGRRPKVYEAGPAEVHVNVPARQHGLLAEVLAQALLRDEAGGAGRQTAAEVAGRRGRELGRAAAAADGGGGLAGARAALERLGFEPYDAGPAVLRLANCPFQPLAGESPELVCGLSRGLVAGLLDGLGAAGVEAVMAPRAGECCVELRARPI